MSAYNSEQLREEKSGMNKDVIDVGNGIVKVIYVSQRESSKRSSKSPEHTALFLFQLLCVGLTI